MSWDDRWMQEARLKASWSKDKSTKVGAVIVTQDNLPVANGWNGFPRGCQDDIESRHERPLKYKWFEHAERNCLYNAARQGTSTKGCTIYTTLYPCTDCARGIIQAGICKVVAPMPDLNDPRWGSDFNIVQEMFKECGIFVEYYFDK